MKQTMRVAMYYNNSDVRLEEMPVPEIGPGEVLVQVIASGICGTDCVEWYRVKRAPLVLGHEIAGEIAAVGDGVTGAKPGDRVFVSHHVPCNTCRYCLAGHHTACHTLHTTNFDPGGFAEYVRVPALQVERGIFVLPDEVSFDAGTFVEPLGCVVRGQRLAGMRPGTSVLVIGAGISGLLHVKLARASGAGRIIAVDTVEKRLEYAHRFGATAVIQAPENIEERLRDLNDGRGADLVILCTGASSAHEQALSCVDAGGTVLWFAPPGPDMPVMVPVEEFWRREITLMTSYGAPPGDMEAALELIRAGRVEVEDMITHRLPLEQVQEGFRLVAEARDSIKVILDPTL